MRRRFLRWIPVAILVAVTVIAATVWAKTTHMQDTIGCPGVDARGKLTSLGGKKAPLTITINEATLAYHGKTHVKVTNLAGGTITFLNHPFSVPGETTSTYVVKANGNATVTIHGILPPSP